MRNLCLDAALDELTRAGIHDPVIARGAKHLQRRWTTTGTPSDWRSAENVRHDLRKILRGDGMLMTPQPRSAPVKQPSRIELLERRLAEVERRLGILDGR